MAKVNPKDVYETNAIKQLENILKYWNNFRVKCILLYGETGVGKTFSVNYLAQKHGFDVVSYGCEEKYSVEEIIASANSGSWTGSRKIVLLDRPLWWMTMADLRRIVENTKNPIIIEIDTSEIKYYRSLQCLEVRVTPPPKTWIVQQIKKLKIVDKPKYSMIREDVRQALMLAYGSEGYSNKDWLLVVEKFFKTGDASKLEPSHLPVLLDTGLTAYYGVELYRFIERLVVADLLKKLDILNGMKAQLRNYQVSLRYYEKIRELKQGKK